MNYAYMYKGSSHISTLPKKPIRFQVALNNLRYKANSFRLIKKKVIKDEIRLYV